MKVLKWALVGLLLFIVVAVGGALTLVATLDPNDYKPQIAAQVKKATGRNLIIAGDISWSFFPWVGLNIGKTTLSNAEGFGNEPFAQFDAVGVKVALLPLLKKQIKAKKIEALGVSLNLEKNQAGKTNWEDLLHADQTAEAKPAERTGTEQGAVMAIDIAGIALTDAQLRYADAHSGTTLLIKPLNITTGRLAWGVDVPVSLDLALSQNDTALWVNLKGQLSADPNTGVYQGDGLDLAVTLKGAGLPPDGVAVNLGLGFSANTQTQTLQIKPLRVDALGIQAEGGLAVEQFIDAPHFTGQLKTSQFNPRQVAKQLDIALPPTANSKALNSAALAVDFSGNLNSVRADTLELRLDDSQLTGRAAVEDLKRLATRFDLALDRINVDDYLPPASASESASTGGTSPTATTDKIELPVALLRSLDMQGTLTVKSLIVKKLQLTDASLAVKAHGGRLEINPLKAQLYGGAASMVASLDVTRATPRYAAQIDLQGVRSAEILEALLGDRYVSGIAMFKTSLKTSGERISTLKAQLQGTAQASFKEGTIKGSKLSRQINEARNVLRKFQGKPPVTEAITDETRFSQMTMTATLHNGVVSNDDLFIEAPIFVGKGAGTIDLPKSYLNYTLSLAQPGDADKANRYLPLHIKGPFEQLSFKLEADKILKLRLKEEEAKAKARLRAEQDKLKQQLKAEQDKKQAELKAKAEAEKSRLQEQVKQKQDELKQNLEDQLQDQLKGLFR